MMTRRFKFNILTVLAVSSGSFFSAVAMADGEEDGTEGPGIAEVSIWDDSEALDTASNAGGLQTSSSETIQPPILVPLPAPLIAAGTGLGLAWLVRRRMSRS